MRRVIAAVLILGMALLGATPAWAILGLPSPEDLLIWLVLRPWMHRNQDTQIANQIRELQKMVAELRTASGQLAQVRNMAQGQIGAIASPIADLMALPACLLDTARDWQDDFTGPAGDLIGTLTDFRAGTSLSESWRDILDAADTVSEADIRAVYAGGAGDRTATAYAARRAAAEDRLARIGARADAAADIQELRAATTATLDTVAGRIDADPLTGGPNRSGTALDEGTAIGGIAQLRMLIGMGRGQAVASGAAAAEATAAEVARREMEAERLAGRTALEAEWAAARAALEANRADRLESLYGGFPLHPLFGGTP